MYISQAASEEHSSKKDSTARSFSRFSIELTLRLLIFRFDYTLPT